MAHTRSPFRDTLEYWAALAVLGSLSVTPLSVANRLGHFYARLLDRLLPRLRRVAMQNLAMAFPAMSEPERARIAGDVFRSIGRLLTAFARFPSIDRQSVSARIGYEGYEHFAAANARGKGVLFATAHLGNWELSAYAHALLSEPMNVVVRPLDNPKIDALIERRRTLSGNRLISKREFARPILKALHHNQAVGVLVDQNASLDSGVFVDFFGVPACVNPGFAKLAARSGATVIPGFALWSEEKARYVLRFYPPVPITGDAEVDTREIQRSLEAAIREHPGQWLWIHRRWKTRPPGEPALYV